MSFRTDFKAALVGSDVLTADNWASFWLLAAPLGRDMLVHHDTNGAESLIPERNTDYYEAKFFSGDCLGLVRNDEGGQPINASIVKKVSDDTLEHVLRLGFAADKTNTRKMLWDLGYRKLLMDVHSSKEARLVERLERRNKGKYRKLTSPDEQFGYSRFEVALDRPTKEKFDDPDSN